MTSYEYVRTLGFGELNFRIVIEILYSRTN